MYIHTGSTIGKLCREEHFENGLILNSHTKKKRFWTSKEDKIITDSILYGNIPTYKLAKKLKRTPVSVECRKIKLLNDIKGGFYVK